MNFQLKSILLGAITIFPLCMFAQNINLSSPVDITPVLSESSGITFIAPNSIYTHNDSGGSNELFELDTLGNLIRTLIVTNATNDDWEDVTHDNANNIYIGDFGNNNNDRTNLRIYKINDPSGITGNSVTASLIEFNLPDQTMFPPVPSKRNYDAEAFLWYNDSLFIFTKNRTSPFNGYCKMYKVPATPGNYTAELCDSIFLCNSSQSDCWVTSAAINPDNNHIVLLNHNKLFWFSCFTGSAFFNGAMAIAPLSSNTQKEGISFKNNNQIFITDEYSAIDNNGGNLYQASINDYNQMAYVNFNSDSVICDNCSLSVDSFIGALSWSNGMFGPSITPGYTGWFYVTARNFNNCEVTDSIYVSYLQGIARNEYVNSRIKITTSSSNNITGQLLNAPQGTYTLRLLDLSGNILYQEAFHNSSTAMSFSVNILVQSGLYFLELQSLKHGEVVKLVIPY